MPHYLPLDRQRHREGGWRPYVDYAFAAGDALVPVILDELPPALACMPLAFRPVEGTGFELVAVQSLTNHLNLFVDADGRWLGSYVPAHYRGYPFRLLPLPESQRMAIGLDADSGLILDRVDDQGEPFFTTSGELAPKLNKLRTFLEKVEEGRRRTERAVSALNEHGLIEPWPLKAEDAEGAPHDVDGLYRIDEASLNALPAESLWTLRDAGALTLAYAQLFSQHRLASLSRLYRERHERAIASPATTLEELFGQEDDLSFDFQ